MIDPETLKAMRALNRRTHEQAHGRRVTPAREPDARQSRSRQVEPPIPPSIMQPEERT